MSEVPLLGFGRGIFRLESGNEACYRGTSLIRNTPSPYDPTVALCVGTCGGFWGWVKLMSEVPL